MKSLSCIILLMAAECHGLQLFLDSSTTGSSSCGTLTCEEAVTSTDVDVTDPTMTYSERNITSMSIYRRRTGPDGLSGHFGERDEGKLLVTLTKTRITVMDSSLDVVYGGHLTDSQATLRLGLVSLESCHSEYTCKVFQTDLNGAEHINEQSTTIDNKPLTDQCASDSYMPYLTEPQSCERDMIPVQFQTLFPYVEINPNEDSVTQVPIVCETHSLGGGWVVFQRRSTGNVDFERGSDDYKKGFGSSSDDFWLGLDTIHDITSSGTYELLVYIVYEGLHYSAHYETFSISGEADDYTVRLGAYDGTAGDCFSVSDGMPFNTEIYKGGWWYNRYAENHLSHLNGVWLSEFYGLLWQCTTDTRSASFSQMMIRKINEQ